MRSGREGYNNDEDASVCKQMYFLHLWVCNNRCSSDVVDDAVSLDGHNVSMCNSKLSPPAT